MNRPRRKDRHLPPCVYHRHGAYWLVRAGKWQRLGTELGPALAEYARRIEAAPGTMPDLIERAYATMLPNLAPSTAQQYRVAAEKLKTILREFSPEQVQPRHVAAIKLKFADKKSMGNRVLSFLRQVFALALEWQLVDRNPCVGIKRHEDRKRDRYLTHEEFHAIRAAAEPRLQIIVELLYLTAQRITDVLAIRHADLTEDGILFRPRKNRNSTKVKLCVAWSTDLRAAVERAKTLRGNVRALTLLHGRTGKAPDYRTVLKQWEDACTAAGVVDATPHDLRAKSLTDAKKQGQDVQALAGHASEAMTKRYLRLRETVLVSGPVFGAKDGQTKKA